MRSIAPRTGGDELTLAEDQPEYSPITIAVHADPAWGPMRIYVSRWRLTDEERTALLAGDDLYIGILLGSNDLMPPLNARVGPGDWQLRPEGVPE